MAQISIVLDGGGGGWVKIGLRKLKIKGAFWEEGQA